MIGHRHFTILVQTPRWTHYATLRPKYQYRAVWAGALPLPRLINREDAEDEARLRAINLGWYYWKKHPGRGVRVVEVQPALFCTNYLTIWQSGQLKG